jgi:uncharacterized cupin superfamily protein
MTGAQGVYVSRLSTTDWEPDPDVPGLMHVLCSTGGVEAGLTRIDQVDGPITYAPPAREVLLILEGRARIEMADAPTLDLGPGDMASLPKGATTTWFLTTPFREFWVLAGE